MKRLFNIMFCASMLIGCVPSHMERSSVWKEGLHRASLVGMELALFEKIPQVTIHDNKE